MTVNEDVLKAMAAASGGRYLREEQVGRLPSLIAPLGRERVVESETPLWRQLLVVCADHDTADVRVVAAKRAGLM